MENLQVVAARINDPDKAIDASLLCELTVVLDDDASLFKADRQFLEVLAPVELVDRLAGKHAVADRRENFFNTHLSDGLDRLDQGGGPPRRARAPVLLLALPRLPGSGGVSQ